MEFRRRRQPGQSTVLLALMLVVVVGMTGLSVDVGNAYAQQRLVQSAANAGALAGMNAVLNKQTNAQVWNSVQESLAGNRIDTDSADYTYKAEYLLKDRTVKMLGEWNGTRNTFTTGTPPAIDTLARVQVTVTERVDTYFARVVGRNNFTVNEGGEACFGNYGIGVYPIGVPFKLEPYEKDKNGKYVVDKAGNKERYHRLYREVTGLLVEVDPNDSVWNNGGDWEMIRSQKLILYLPAEKVVPGVHVAWLDWDGDNSDAYELKKRFTEPGDLQNEFVEAPVGDKSLVPEQPRTGSLDLYDWISGANGLKASATGDEYMGSLLNDEVLLPMWDADDEKSSSVAYRFYRMGTFKIVGYDFGGKENGPKLPTSTKEKYIMLQYLKDSTGGTANGCS